MTNRITPLMRTVSDVYNEERTVSEFRALAKTHRKTEKMRRYRARVRMRTR